MTAAAKHNAKYTSRGRICGPPLKLKVGSRSVQPGRVITRSSDRARASPLYIYFFKRYSLLPTALSHMVSRMPLTGRLLPAPVLISALSLS